MKTFYKIFAAALFSFLIANCTLNIENCSAQWVQVSNGMGNISVGALAYSGNNIFAGAYDPAHGVYLSTNNGTNWAQTSLNNRIVYSLAVNGNSNIFAGTDFNQGVYLSTDKGANWTQVGLNGQSVYSLAVSGNNIFAGTGFPGLGVYLSTNNGTSWTQTSLNNRNVLSLAANANNVYAGTYQFGVYVSTDNGTSWTQTSLNNRDVHAFAVSGNNVFAGTYSYGVYLSTDNGTSWAQTSLNNQSVYSLAVNGNNIFAGTVENGVYVSNDNGTKWIQRNDGLGNLSVLAFCIFNNYIFAGTGAGNGVYRRPLGELVPSPVTGSLKGIVEGFYNTGTGKLNIRDTVGAYLRNTSSPFAIVDSAKAVIDSVTFTGSFLFSNATSGIYYIQLKHRNSIETWSKSPGQVYTLGSALVYDFTDSSSKAYGNNLIQKGTKFCIYGGDVNQDGTVDLNDIINVFNDANSFLSGYVVTDVNGDYIVNLSDLILTYNNSINFVHVIRP